MDKKLLIAIGIIILLVLTLATVLFIKPSIQTYFNNQKLNSQIELINAIISQANIDGYIILSNGTDEVTLIKYIPDVN